jgi:hypothetical protein
MNMQAHLVLIICDIFAVWGLWLGYNSLHEIQSGIAAQVDTIRYGNRIGFAIVGVAFPLFHILFMVEKLWTDFIKKYSSIANIGIVILLSTLILGGIAGSHWVKSHVENAGYIYCWRASGSGAVSKTLVYTKDMEICEKLVEDDRRHTRTMPKKQVYYPSQLQ